VPDTDTETRRSQRLYLGLQIIVSGETSSQKPFKSAAITVAFNAQGALLILHQKVNAGQTVLMLNPVNRDHQKARVVYTSGPRRRQHVGVEFLTPAPGFWGVDRPPHDWEARTAAESTVLSKSLL